MFGPTLQGEGKSQGRAVMFLRLGLCNLDCSWCDTPYTWDWTGKNGIVFDKQKELSHVMPGDIYAWARTNAYEHNVRRIVVTGGEPLLQQRRLAPIVEGLARDGFDVEVETNGTILPNETMVKLCEFNVSPKMASSGVHKDIAIDYETLEALKQASSTFKFVVADDVDLMEVDEVVNRLDLQPDRVFIMPEGRTRTAILGNLPWLFDMCAQRGWQLSPRLHVLAFNDKRGV